MPRPVIDRLCDRYLFTGKLVMESGLHIGGGRDTLMATDSPVMKYIDDRPFIPGSSLKGAFRSAVEKLAAALPERIQSCGLFVNNHPTCPTQDREMVRQAARAESAWLDRLCFTCGLFGSPFMSGKLRFSDMTVIENTWAGVTEIRDGVGIDRDTECAVAQIKYDYEVVPSETAFSFRLQLESPEAERQELALTAIGLREFQAGMVAMGGIKTRGLGQCVLQDLTVYHLPFGDAGKFKAYLKAGQLESAAFRLSPPDAETLLNQAIDGLFG